MAAGDVFVTNDPAAGGSHLPDVTVVTPVHDRGGTRRFFVASRGHHADVGGITPGSMPPFSRRLEEEGVVLRALRIVSGGRFDEAAVLGALEGATHPARSPRENLADLEAQIAANATGVAPARRDGRALRARGGRGLHAARPGQRGRQGRRADRAPAGRGPPFRRRPRRRDADRRRAARRGRSHAGRLLGHRATGRGQPERAPGRHPGGGDLRAADARRRGHPAQRRLPRARDRTHPRGLGPGPRARGGRLRGQRGDLAARGRRAARRARTAGRVPGHDEQPDLRQRALGLLRDHRGGARARVPASTARRACTRT